MAKEIILYSKPGCAGCVRVKEYFAANSIAYTEKDVMKDRAALAELMDRGFLSTPVTLIDGEAVVGFELDKFETLLG